MAEIIDQAYGKARVRFVKVDRPSKDTHIMREFEARVLLSGDALLDTYKTGDNSRVVPTDTCKNTIHYLARTTSFTSPEEFAGNVCQHFLQKYPWVEKVLCEMEQVDMRRAQVNGKESGFTFVPGGASRRTGKAVRDRRGTDVIEGGIKDYKIVKTTNSEFVGFNKCDLTTLPSEKDRLMGTIARLSWTLNKPVSGPAYESIAARALDAFVSTFATHYSHSLQETMQQVAMRVFADIGEVDTLTMSCPNVHNIPIQMSQFGVSNNNVVLLPIDEPHGDLNATFRRPRARM